MATGRATERQQGSQLSEAEDVVRHKRAAAWSAAEMVKDGMCVGLGTGTTVAYLLDALAQRELERVRYTATSPATERAAAALGLPVENLDRFGELDVAIDGADQIDADGWLVKGGGGAHTREKIVAAAANRFVVIASAEKLVRTLSPPVPLELVAFGAQHTLRALADARLRGVASPDGGLIADYHGTVGEPRELAARLSATPGIIEHGLFAPEMVSLIIVAGEDGVERRAGRKPGSG